MRTTRSVWGLSTSANGETEPSRDQLRRSQMESLFTAALKEQEGSETNCKMISNLHVKKLPLALDESRSSMQDGDTLTSTTVNLKTGRRSMPLRSHDARLPGMSVPANQTETLWYNDSKAPRMQLPKLAMTLGSMRKAL